MNDDLIKRVGRAALEALTDGAAMQEELAYAYLSGMLDGDGCIAILRRPPNKGYPDAGYQYYPYVSVSKTNRELIQALHNTFKVGGVFKGTGRQFEWRVTNNAAAELVRRCTPYLKGKGAHIELIEEIQRLKETKASKEDQTAVYDKMRALYPRNQFKEDALNAIE